MYKMYEQPLDIRIIRIKIFYIPIIDKTKKDPQRRNCGLRKASLALSADYIIYYYF